MHSEDPSEVEGIRQEGAVRGVVLQETQDIHGSQGLGRDQMMGNRSISFNNQNPIQHGKPHPMHPSFPYPSRYIYHSNAPGK